MPLSPKLFSVLLEVLAIAIRQEKTCQQRKSNGLFVVGKIIYVENPISGNQKVVYLWGMWSFVSNLVIDYDV